MIKENQRNGSLEIIRMEDIRQKMDGENHIVEDI